MISGEAVSEPEKNAVRSLSFHLSPVTTREARIIISITELQKLYGPVEYQPCDSYERAGEDMPQDRASFIVHFCREATAGRSPTTVSEHHGSAIPRRRTFTKETCMLQDLTAMKIV